MKIQLGLPQWLKISQLFLIIKDWFPKTRKIWNIAWLFRHPKRRKPTFSIPLPWYQPTKIFVPEILSFSRMIKIKIKLRFGDSTTRLYSKDSTRLVKTIMAIPYTSRPIYFLDILLPIANVMSQSQLNLCPVKALQLWSKLLKITRPQMIIRIILLIRKLKKKLVNFFNCKQTADILYLFFLQRNSQEILRRDCSIPREF